MPRVGGVPENLTPVKAGDPPLNPEGRNQYTYRREFETTITNLLKGKLTKPELDALDLPPYILHIAESGELKRGELIAIVTVYRAMKADKDGMAEALARLWPKVEKHEVDLIESSDESVLDRLAGIARARRGNGHDPDPLTTGKETPQ